MRPVIDPRDGDIEDDASSPGRHSLLSLAGSLLAEISFPKLAVASIWLIIMPGLLLGLAPVAASVWFDALHSKLSAPLAELWPALLLVAIVIGGLIGGRTLLRLAESSFWSLNALAVQPGYMACREGLRHAAERWLPAHATSAQLDRLRAIMAAIAGAIVCALALLVLATLANSVVIVSGYLAVVALAWGIMDATIAQPRDLGGYFVPPAAGRRWRIAHLSDIHMVGERYGFRIESGRSGPRGNDRFAQILNRIAAIHAAQPLDLILITGDMTDAGIATEWAQFLDAVDLHP